MQNLVINQAIVFVRNVCLNEKQSDNNTTSLLILIMCSYCATILPQEIISW